MRIQHNIAALNSYRNLTGNNNAVAKNLEKLSSGYRINRAGDDAAGLAISEKMRAQITGCLLYTSAFSACYHNHLSQRKKQSKRAKFCTGKNLPNTKFS